MEDKIQEIMEEVRMYGAAWFVSGQQQSVSDKDALYFESKAQGHLLEIQSKLRELVERCSVQGSLSDTDLHAEYLEDISFEGECSAFLAGARYAERFHNITNTIKE